MRKKIFIIIILCLTAMLPWSVAAQKETSVSKTTKTQSTGSSHTLQTQSVLNDDGSIFITSTLEDGTTIITVIDREKNVTQTRVNDGEKHVNDTQKKVGKTAEDTPKRVYTAVEDMRESATKIAKEALKLSHKAIEDAFGQVTIIEGQPLNVKPDKSGDKFTGGSTTLFSGKPITAIRNMGFRDVEVRYGSTPCVEFQGINKGSLPSKMIEYDNGMVVIRSDSKIDTDKDIKVIIYSSDLRSLSSFGVGDIISKYVYGPVLDISVLGSGDIILDEIQSANLKLLINGSGDIHCKNVSATTLQAVINGSGDIIVDKATGTTMECVVQGSGDIFLKGIESTLLRATSLGSGDIEVSGNATSASYSARGSGLISVGGLKAVRSTSSNYGTGAIVY